MDTSDSSSDSTDSSSESGGAGVGAGGAGSGDGGVPRGTVGRATDKPPLSEVLVQNRGAFEGYLDVGIDEITPEGLVTLKLSEQLQLIVENVTLYSEEDIDIDIESPYYEDFGFTFTIVDVTNETIVL